MTTNEIFAKNLSYLMDKYDVSRKDLAYACDVDESTVSKWKVGNNAPNGKHLTDLAKVFGVTPNSFYVTNDLLNDGTALDEESFLLQEFRQLTSDSKKELMKYIHELAYESWCERNGKTVVKTL